MELYTVLYNWTSTPGLPVELDCSFSETLDTRDPYNKPVQKGSWFNYDV